MTRRIYTVTIKVEQERGFLDGVPPEVGDLVSSGTNGPCGETWPDWSGEVTHVDCIEELD